MLSNGKLFKSLLHGIGAGGFYSGADGTVTINGGTVTATGGQYGAGIGTCTDTDIVIPLTSPAGDKVTSIGSYAFYGCTNMTIYCEAASKPSGWSSSWNPNNRPVIWGYTGS